MKGQEYNAALSELVDLRTQLATQTERADRAEAACAELSGALEKFLQSVDLINKHSNHQALCDINRVLYKSSPPVRGWLSPEVAAKVREELKAIESKVGPFSKDPLKHAGNCIDAMAEHATAALALLSTGVKP